MPLIAVRWNSASAVSSRPALVNCAAVRPVSAAACESFFTVSAA
jgi:hypothetical protein